MFMGSRQEHKFSAVTIFTISSTFHLFPLGFFDCSINFLRSTSTPKSKNNNKRVGIMVCKIKRRPETDAYRSLLVGRGSLKRDQGPVTPGVTKIRRQRQRERQSNNRFNEQNNNSARASPISLPSLHNYNVKWPKINFT